MPHNLSVGDGSHIGQRVELASWAKITIGRDVIINTDVSLLTGSHDVNSPVFEGKVSPITIGDHAWLPKQIQVLPGVRIGECAVIGTGAVVVSDVPDYAIFAGNPARQVGERKRQTYTYRPTRL